MPKKNEKPTNKGKTIDKLDNYKKDKFLQFFSQDEVRGNISMTCKAVGISRQTYYDWLDNDKKFRTLVKDAKLEMCDDMEQILISRAVDKSDTALIFWLKNRHPDFKEKPQFMQQINAEEMKIEFIKDEGGE